MVGVDHFDDNVARELIALNDFFLAGSFSDVDLQGNLYIKDIILKVVVFDHVAKVGFHRVFIS